MCGFPGEKQFTTRCYSRSMHTIHNCSWIPHIAPYVSRVCVHTACVTMGLLKVCSPLLAYCVFPQWRGVTALWNLDLVRWKLLGLQLLLASTLQMGVVPTYCITSLSCYVTIRSSTVSDTVFTDMAYSLSFLLETRSSLWLLCPQALIFTQATIRVL